MTRFSSRLQKSLFGQTQRLMIGRFLYFTLVFVAALHTLWLQSTWDDWFNPFTNLGGVSLWAILAFWWLIQLIRAPQLRPVLLVAPAIFAFLILCDWTHLPIKLRFEFQKSHLEHFARGPQLDRRFRSQGATPIHVEKRGQAVRILLEKRGFLAYGEYFGFARCPSGCETVDFSPLFYDAVQTPEYIALRNGWFAVRLNGSDF